VIRLLLIAYYFPPMGGSGVQRPLKIGKYLAKKGIQVTYLVPAIESYHVMDHTLEQELVSSEQKFRIIRVKEGIPLQSAWMSRIQAHYRTFLSTWSTQITSWFYLPDNKKGWIEPALRYVERAHRDTPFDAVFATASPYSNLLLAAQIKKKLNLPVMMDLRDDWLKSHLIRYPTRWHNQRMARLERETLQLADEITVINESVKQSLLNRIPEIPIPKVLSNGYDPEDFEAAEKMIQIRNASSASPDIEKSKDERFSSTCFHILYNGLFYGVQQPDTFLKGIKLATKKNPELLNVLRLHFQGDFFDRHLALAAELKLKDKIFAHGNLPHIESISGLLQADLLWLIVPNQPHSKGHTPGKLFEYLGTLKPILGMTDKGQAYDLLTQYEASYFADPDQPESVATAVEQAFDHWKRKQMPVGNRQFIQQFDRSIQGQHLMAWIQDLVMQHNRKSKTHVGVT